MSSTGNPAVLSNARNFIIQDAKFIAAQTVNIGAEVSGLGQILGPEQNNTDMDTNNGLPLRPKLFVGRENIVAEITSTLVSSKHAALVGTGGIGKSYIASAILHEHDITVKFKQHRYFVRYDNVSPFTLNFETFLDRIVGTLGVIARPKEDRRDAVLQHLRKTKNDTLLILDNAETFLDSKHDLKPISDFVVELGDMTSVSLMFTTRTKAIPPLVGCDTFNIPGLEKIPAREAFMSLYKSDISPESVDKLLSAVEFHPLSITLLANAGAVNNWSPKMLEEAWERESALVMEKSGAAGGFGITVEMSLKSPSIAKLGEIARTFLHVVAFLPQGVHHKRLKLIFPSITNIHDISDAMCVHSLTYCNGNYITMLAPIRLYILHRYAKEVARDTCFDSAVRTYYRSLLMGTELEEWVVGEKANIECLLALDLKTPTQRALLVRMTYRYLLYSYPHHPVNFESLVLALPEDRSKIFHRVLRSFTQPRLIRLLGSAPSPSISLWLPAASEKILWKVDCLVLLGLYNFRLGFLTAAIRLWDQAIQFRLSRKEWAKAFPYTLTRAVALTFCGKYPQAEITLKQAHHLSRKTRDPELQATADLATGWLLLRRGDPEGVSLFQSADKTFEKLDSPLRSFSLTTSGDSTLRLPGPRDSSTAQGYYNTLMELDHDYVLVAKMGLISVAFSKGEVGLAFQMRDELATVHPTIEAVDEKILVLSRLVNWAADEGRFADARDYVRTANLLQELTPLNFLLEAKLSEARVEFFDRCFIKARELLIEVADICRELVAFKMKSFRALGEIAILENDHETAKEYFSRVKEFCDENGVDPEIFGGDKFLNWLTNEITQKDIFRGWPDFIERERGINRKSAGKSAP